MPRVKTCLRAWLHLNRLSKLAISVTLENDEHGTRKSAVFFYGVLVRNSSFRSFGVLNLASMLNITTCLSSVKDSSKNTNLFQYCVIDLREYNDKPHQGLPSGEHAVY